MASSAQPDPELLLHFLHQARDFLLNEAIPQVRAAVSEAESNHAQCVALVRAHQVGLAQIYVLVEIVLRGLAAPFRLSQLNGKLGGCRLALLLVSLAEIERFVQSGRRRMSSSSELLDSGVGYGSSSRMRFFLLREFFFSLDLARLGFVSIMLGAEIHLDESWGSSRYSRSDVEEQFCSRPLQLHELFEWCERRRRPVLKQGACDLGRESTQHMIVSNELDGFAWMVYGLSSIWTADLELDVEEPSAESRDSLPLEIDFKDVHNQEFLGQGSYGAVFRCSWRGQIAAMKLIKLDIQEPELERRFEMEVRILASLQHPNAVPVFGFGYTEGRAKGFFVMEHMQTDLENVIREIQRRGVWRVFPPEVAMDIMSQIAEGMCALRRQRVIHRDLKPANILVNQIGIPGGFYDVKLADFGSANVRDDLGSVFRTLRAGTVAYMAPEVMSPTLLPDRGDERAGYSWKADVYSFAMVCSEILSGERPFRHLGRMDKILAAVSGGERPELRLGGEDPLRRLIEDCWKFKAEERPDFEEVRRRLWECRVYHFFSLDEEPTSLQMFLTRLDGRTYNNTDHTSNTREEGLYEAYNREALNTDS